MRATSQIQKISYHMMAQVLLLKPLVITCWTQGTKDAGHRQKTLLFVHRSLTLHKRLPFAVNLLVKTMQKTIHVYLQLDAMGIPLLLCDPGPAGGVGAQNPDLIVP